MKRCAARWGVCLLAVLALVGTSACSVATPPLSEREPAVRTAQVTPEALVAADTLTVAVDTSDAPLTLTDASGNVTGYTVDVARALGKELGLSVNVVEGTPSSVCEGAADLFIATAQSSLTEDEVSAGTVLSDATALFARTGSSDASSVDAASLQNARIAVQDGSASQQALQDANVSYSEVGCANVNECLEALESGRADYAACDASAGSYLARTYGDISLAGTLGAPSAYVVAAASSNGEVSQAASDALSALAQNGVLAAVRTAWFGTLPDDLASLQVPGLEVSEQNAAGDAGASGSESGGSTDAVASNASGAGAAGGTGSSTAAGHGDLSALNSTARFF